jgi:hypothetical protein
MAAHDNMVGVDVTPVQHFRCGTAWTCGFSRAINNALGTMALGEHHRGCCTVNKLCRHW